MWKGMGGKMSRRKDDWELEELDLEKELGEPEEDDREETDDWSEPGPLKPGTILLVFLGLAVLAAVICGILWNITHRDRAKEEETVEYTTEVSDGSAEPEGQGTSVPSSVETSPVSEPGNQEAPEPSSEGEEPGSEAASSPSVEGTGPITEPGSQEASEPSAEASEPIGVPLLPAETPEPTPTPTHAPEPTPTPAPAAEPTPAPTPAANSDANRVSTIDGRVIVFTDCDDTVSPKEYVNLRLEPSTSEGNSTVHCRLNYGETVHRTGISEDSGWSRVEKDGVTCYVVTSFIYVVE